MEIRSLTEFSYITLMNRGLRFPKFNKKKCMVDQARDYLVVWGGES